MSEIDTGFLLLEGAVEALLFASGEPITFRELKVVLEKHGETLGIDLSGDELTKGLKEVLRVLLARWGIDGETLSSTHGFELVEVANGYGFRTKRRFSDLVRGMREQRPIRLSKAALETLAIVAYRQPATKVEVDFVRGVDCGGTLRILLERSLLRIVGKKEEPGRPLLYGTTQDFLSFFNLRSLKELPSLRAYQELAEDSKEALTAFDDEFREFLATASATAESQDELELDGLEGAVKTLEEVQDNTRTALAEEGIILMDE